MTRKDVRSPKVAPEISSNWNLKWTPNNHISHSMPECFVEYIWRGHTAKCAIHKRKEADFFLPSRSTYYLRQRLWWEATCFPSLKKSLAIPGNCCMQILPCRGFMWFLYVCLLSEPGGLCWPQIPIMTAFQLTASMPMHRSQFKIFIYISNIYIYISISKSS